MNMINIKKGSQEGLRVIGEIRKVLCYQNKVWRHQLKTMKNDCVPK